jgi:DNA-binding NtrC family response regulator
MSSVVLCLCPDRPGEAVCASLRVEGLRLVHCSNRDLLLEDLVQHRPDALIYTLRHQQAADLAVLQLVRRLVPDLPVVLVAEEGSLHTEKLVRELRPVYYAVSPVEGDELREAVQSALSRRTRTAPNRVTQP